jgi:enoyl-CoA hydratase/carnithine racemase
MLGERVGPEEAVGMGLASRVIPDEELAAETQLLARRLADGPTMAYAATKLLIGREQDMDLGSAIEMEAFVQALMMTTADHAEFYRAFTGKRPPEWTGR